MRSSSSFIAVTGFMSFQDLCASINWVQTSLGNYFQLSLPFNKLMSHVIKTCMSASYDRKRAVVTLLYCFPIRIWSTVTAAYTPESTSMSLKPPLLHNFPMHAMYEHFVWKGPR